MRKKQSAEPSTVLDELRALEHQPTKRAHRLIARHLKCRESLQLSQIIAEAARKSASYGNRPLEAPSEILPPLV